MAGAPRDEVDTGVAINIGDLQPAVKLYSK